MQTQIVMGEQAGTMLELLVDKPEGMDSGSGMGCWECRSVIPGE